MEKCQSDQWFLIASPQPVDLSMLALFLIRSENRIGLGTLIASASTALLSKEMSCDYY
jgi:hypothetical protein